MQVELKILDPRLAHLEPSYATPGSAGIDLRACIPGPTIILPGEARYIPSGLAMHISDPGYAAMILPRSGLGANNGIVLGNLVGLVDSDYQGNVGMSIWNRSAMPFLLEPMARVAQLIIVPVVQAKFVAVREFSASSERGAGGFGSTGVA